jgi:hypothetical protein
MDVFIFSFPNLLTLKANFPENSSIPQENKTDKTSATASPFRTLSPVIGHTPPFARVDATTDRTSHVVSKLEVLIKNIM